MFSKNIHLIFFPGAYPEPPTKWLQNVEQWRRHHPTPVWNVRVWSLPEIRKLITDHFPWFLATFSALETVVEKVDAARYAVLATIGGIYVDMDSAPLRNISGLLAAYEGIPHVRTLLSDSPPLPGMPNNSFLASRDTSPGNFFESALLEIRRRAPESRKGMRSMDDVYRVFWTTGSIMLADLTRRSQRQDRLPSVVIVSRALTFDAAAGPGTNYIVDAFEGSWFSASHHNNFSPLVRCKQFFNLFRSQIALLPPYKLHIYFLGTILILTCALSVCVLISKRLHACRFAKNA